MIGIAVVCTVPFPYCVFRFSISFSSLFCTLVLSVSLLVSFHGRFTFLASAGRGSWREFQWCSCGFTQSAFQSASLNKSLDAAFLAESSNLKPVSPCLPLAKLTVLTRRVGSGVPCSGTNSFHRCQGSKSTQEYVPSRTNCWRSLIC